MPAREASTSDIHGDPVDRPPRRARRPPARGRLRARDRLRRRAPSRSPSDSLRPALAGSTSSTSTRRAVASRQTPPSQSIVAATAGRVRLRGRRGTARLEAERRGDARRRCRPGRARHRLPSTIQALLGRLVERHGPDRVVVALDVRDGLGRRRRLAARRARCSASRSRWRRWPNAGVGWLRRDRDRPRRRARRPGPRAARPRGRGVDRGAIIASGGISSVADLEAVRALGCAGGDRRPRTLRGPSRPPRRRSTRSTEA